MGCFSFMCKGCGKPILSNSFRGQKVILFLLKEGEVIEKMEGEYDSYGCVFDQSFESVEWRKEWSEVCNLMFDKNRSNGIAAIHSKCFNGVVPIIRSKSDPNQGWGEDLELLSSSSRNINL